MKLYEFVQRKDEYTGKKEEENNVDEDTSEKYRVDIACFLPGKH